MAGKSFKGNLEVLNLSDIFQSLAMNRHSGTLIVHDGKREKKIFFAEGEITLLSTSKRMRLGDLLIASSKITEEDLDLALKLQKQSRKKLGEILVEEGFCEEDDISRLLRVQIEDELYDLFLWRKAEFEFLADQMPDDMAAESPNLTRLNINTNSLIMEALRRLDEWSLIQNLVPSTKEVFTVSDVDKFPAADVPDRVKGDPALIDGKTNVEGLAEKYLLSEFELCQHLAELVKRGAIQALNQEQLAEKAEASYALNDFSASAALYGRLAEYYPNEPKIMVPLADSMRRSGAEKQALALYEELATRLEEDGRDPDRLRQCYEAITQLDPTRLDLARKLENIELEMASAPTVRSFVVPLLVILVLVSIGGGVFAFRDEIFKPKTPDDSGDAAELLEKGRRAEADGKPAEAHGFYVKILEEHKGSKEYNKVELPIVVSTVPPGYDIYVNNVFQASTKVEQPTLTGHYGPANRVVVEVYSLEGKGRGEAPLEVREFEDPHVFHSVVFTLFSKPLGSQITEAWMEYGVAYSEKADVYLAPSRSGKLRVFKIESGTLMEGRPYDGKVVLGQQGDMFTEPQVVADTLFVGTTDEGVLAVPLGDGTVPDDAKRLYPAAYQVSGRPLVLPAKAPFSQGRVVFGTAKGKVFGYTLDGGAAVWTSKTEGAPIGAPLFLPGVQLNGASAGAAVFSSSDARVYCFSLLDGKAVWTHISDVPVVGPPMRFQDEILVPVTEGKVVALSPETGEKLRVIYEEPKQRAVALLDGGDQLYLSTSGRVEALGADGKVVWKFSSPGEEAPRMALQGENLLIAGGGARVFAVRPKDGMVLWQAQFPEGQGHAVSPLSVNGDAFFVGTNKRFLHYCKVSGE